jgi:mannose-6-phosphate isomerase-like protein (cupin superfamily)
MKTSILDTGDATSLDIRGAALTNDAYLRVIQTGAHEQVAVMTLPPDAEIGDEIHPDTDQLFVVVEGVGEARVGELSVGIAAGDLVFVKAGTRHDIVNRAVEPLRLITTFGPPAFPAGAVYPTRADAPVPDGRVELPAPPTDMPARFIPSSS